MNLYYYNYKAIIILLVHNIENRQEWWLFHRRHDLWGERDVPHCALHFKYTSTPPRETVSGIMSTFPREWKQVRLPRLQYSDTLRLNRTSDDAFLFFPHTPDETRRIILCTENVKLYPLRMTRNPPGRWDVLCDSAIWWQPTVKRVCFLLLFCLFKENLYGTNFKYAWNNFIVDIFYVLFYF